MIRSFRHRGLRLYHETGNSRLLPQAYVRRIIFRFEGRDVVDVDLVDYH